MARGVPEPPVKAASGPPEDPTVVCTVVTPSTAMSACSTSCADASWAASEVPGANASVTVSVSWPESPRKLVSQARHQSDRADEDQERRPESDDGVPQRRAQGGEVAALQEAVALALLGVVARDGVGLGLRAQRPGRALMNQYASTGTIVSATNSDASHGDRHGDGERPEQLPDHAADQRDREEHGDRGDAWTR